jgi:type 1 fimbria pilin
MKKNIIASLIPALAVFSFPTVAAVNPVIADGGKINFTGSVVAAPCAVDNTTDGQTVTLGLVATNHLAAKGDSSPAVPFTIKLTGCDLTSADIADPDTTASYTSASVIFNGTTTGEDTTLAIQAAPGGAGETTTAAQNVGIQILQNNKAVNVNGSTATEVQQILKGTNEIPFSAVYVATADGVVAGTANSTVNFQVSYE